MQILLSSILWQPPVGYAFHDMFSFFFVNSTLSTMNWLPVRQECMDVSRGSRGSWALKLIFSFLFLKFSCRRWREANITNQINGQKGVLGFQVSPSQGCPVYCKIPYNSEDWPFLAAFFYLGDLGITEYVSAIAKEQRLIFQWIHDFHIWLVTTVWCSTDPDDHSCLRDPGKPSQILNPG